MVLKIEQLLGSKNSIEILRFLLLRSSQSYGLSELSRLTHISKSNILRITRILIDNDLIIKEKEGKKQLMRINSSNKLNKSLFEIFNTEKQHKLPADIKNILDLFYKRTKADIFIVFGSVAQGLFTKKSDIDILIVGDKKIRGPVLDYLPFRFEVHNHNLEDLNNLTDFVVLEALLNGIIYKGDLLELISNIKSIPKSYLIYRLNKAKSFFEKSKKLKGLAKEYYANLATVTFGEISSLLEKGFIIPKKEIKIKITKEYIKQLEEKLKIKGDKIWMT